MSKPELLVNWCGHDAAKYAVIHWHYSRSMPCSPVVKIGVWEDGIFIGAVLFSRGSNGNMLTPFGLRITEGAELSRIALTSHETEVTRIVAICLKMIKQTNPGLRLVVSCADPNEDHHGGIYQAGNWVYTGQTDPDCYYIDKMGRRWHSREVSAHGLKRHYGEMRSAPIAAECEKYPLLGKYRYLYQLDRAMRKQIEQLRMDYPASRVRAADGSD